MDYQHTLDSLPPEIILNILDFTDSEDNLALKLT